jgi:hypothetical protein
MNPVQHSVNVIQTARKFFDSWLEKFSSWSDFTQGLASKTLPEFGQSADPIKQVSYWLGGTHVAPAQYAYIAKYGVGAPMLSRFTRIKENTVNSTLTLIGPSEREVRMQGVREAERAAAEAEVRRLKEIEEQARQAQAAKD